MAKAKKTVKPTKGICGTEEWSPGSTDKQTLGDVIEIQHPEEIKLYGPRPTISRNKINWKFLVNELSWTPKQRDLIDLALKKKAKIIFVKAPAGVGKTVIALYCGLKLLQDKLVDKIFYIRSPIESCSKGIGALPGGEAEKMNPYFLPAMDQLQQLLRSEDAEKLIRDKRIEIVPVGFIKGRTFNYSTIVMDEAEDLTEKEFSLIMTRLGYGSTLFLIGDYKQSNIHNSGFTKVFDAFDNDQSKERGIHTFKFGKSDIMRSPIISYILDIFENL